MGNLWSTVLIWNTVITISTGQLPQMPAHHRVAILPGESGWYNVGGKTTIYYGDKHLAHHMNHLRSNLLLCAENRDWTKLSQDPVVNRRKSLYNYLLAGEKYVRDEKLPARFENAGIPCVTIENLPRSEAAPTKGSRSNVNIRKIRKNGAIVSAAGYSK